MNRKKILQGVMIVIGIIMAGIMVLDVLFQPSTPTTPSPVVVTPPSTTEEPAPKIAPLPTRAIQAPVVATIVLSDNAQQVLDDLEQQYLAEIKDKRLAAELKLAISQKALDAEQAPKIAPRKPKQTKVPRKPLTNIIVKSIVFSPKQVKAWVSSNGQLMPVVKGSWLGKAQVKKITENSVAFYHPAVGTVTKYIQQPQYVEKKDKQP